MNVSRMCGGMSMTAGPEFALRVICPFENVLRTGLLMMQR